MLILLGCAAVCTAGILLPLHWIMGIRLAKEDELQGLDVTGKLLSLLIKSENEGLIVIAHGESWEVAASRAVNNLIMKVIEEQAANKGQPQRKVTIDLLCTPANPNEKPITIPLLNTQILVDQHPENNAENGEEKAAYFVKVDHF
jgi:hypothetical protein